MQTSNFPSNNQDWDFDDELNSARVQKSVLLAIFYLYRSHCPSPKSSQKLFYAVLIKVWIFEMHNFPVFPDLFERNPTPHRHLPTLNLGPKASRGISRLQDLPWSQWSLSRTPSPKHRGISRRRQRPHIPGVSPGSKHRFHRPMLVHQLHK